MASVVDDAETEALISKENKVKWLKESNLNKAKEPHCKRLLKQ